MTSAFICSSPAGYACLVIIFEIKVIGGFSNPAQVNCAGLQIPEVDPEGFRHPPDHIATVRQRVERQP